MGECMERWMYGWVGGCMGEWVGGWINGQVGRWVDNSEGRKKSLLTGKSWVVSIPQCMSPSKMPGGTSKHSEGMTIEYQ